MLKQVREKGDGDKGGRMTKEKEKVNHSQNELQKTASVCFREYSKTLL